MEVLAEIRKLSGHLRADVDPAAGVLRLLGADLLVRTRVEDHDRGVVLRAELEESGGEVAVLEAIASDPVEAAAVLAGGIVNRLELPPAVGEPSADPFARTALAIGIQRRSLGEAKAALSYFEVALDRDPTLAQARIELAQALDDVGRTDEALELLLEIAAGADRQEVEAGALVAAFRILIERGRTEEAERRAEEAIALLEGLGDRRQIAQALSQTGVLAYRQGDLDLAESRWREALESSRQASARDLEGQLLRNLAYIELRHGDTDEARRLLQRSLDLFRGLGTPRGELSALGSLGLLANQVGNLGEAQARLEEALAIARELDAPREVMTSLVNLGAVAFGQGDVGTAARHTREAYEIARQMGDPRQTVHTLGSLGYYATRRGRLAEAEDLLRSALEIAGSADVTDARWLLDKNLGYLRCRQGRTEEAEELLGAALEQRREKFGLVAAARCRYAAGRVDAALALLREARESVGPTGGWTAGDAALLETLRRIAEAGPAPLPPLPDEDPVEAPTTRSPG